MNIWSSQKVFQKFGSDFLLPKQYDRRLFRTFGSVKKILTIPSEGFSEPLLYNDLHPEPLGSRQFFSRSCFRTFRTEELYTSRTVRTFVRTFEPLMRKFPDFVFFFKIMIFIKFQDLAPRVKYIWVIYLMCFT